MAEAILQSICDFVNNEKPSSLSLVRLVIFDESMVTIFIEAMKRLIKEKKGLLKTLSEYAVLIA